MLETIGTIAIYSWIGLSLAWLCAIVLLSGVDPREQHRPPWEIFKDKEDK